MSKLWRNLRIGATTAVACGATLAGCGGDDGGDHNVELQIVAGIANAPFGGYIVRVTTPHTTLREALGVGDQTNSDNWTTFDVFLEEGELVEIAVEDSEGNELVAGQCAVQGAVTEGWARAVVFYFAPPNNYVNCANGFAPNL